jgi:hypothetical protein
VAAFDDLDLALLFVLFAGSHRLFEADFQVVPNAVELSQRAVSDSVVHDCIGFLDFGVGIDNSQQLSPNFLDG